MTFTGPDEIAQYRAVVISSGLRLYAKTGMRPNRAYTPTNMLRAASQITGEKYSRGEYIRAAADLDNWIADKRSA